MRAECTIVCQMTTIDYDIVMYYIIHGSLPETPFTVEEAAYYYNSIDNERYKQL